MEILAYNVTCVQDNSMIGQGTAGLIWQSGNLFGLCSYRSSSVAGSSVGWKLSGWCFYDNVNIMVQWSCVYIGTYRAPDTRFL